MKHLDCLNAIWPDDCTFSISVVLSPDDNRLYVEIEWDNAPGDRVVRVPLDVPAELAEADGVWQAIAEHVGVEL
jgi:hypothetical protein